MAGGPTGVGVGTPIPDIPVLWDPVQVVGLAPPGSSETSMVQLAGGLSEDPAVALIKMATEPT